MAPNSSLGPPKCEFQSVLCERASRGVLKIEEALRMAFGRGSVGRGVSEGGRFGVASLFGWQWGRRQIRLLREPLSSRARRQIRMLREPLSSRARRQIRMLRGQHHEADSCCFGIRVGSGRRLARSRFTRLHYESDVSTGLAATGTEARFVSFVVSTTKQIRAASVVVLVVQ